MMWKEKYKVGVPIIDEQHEELFNRVSDFIQTVQTKGSWEQKLVKVKETMAFMQEYVVTHFDDEEVYLEKINYPDLQKHKDAHKQFKDAVNNYVKLLDEQGYSEEVVQEFSAKLMTWLIMHVAAMDQKIGHYVNSQGGKNI
ncbi:bacteriohemerythrin [Heliorestis acidaminivorans]|uniref:Bacteriohemerythrin n=1 Tax=Heliorestis acidaminivorans TaxID=553427 RepID=A0A6I0F447_9FIRM|nr:hemerythrin family protein [Heliorestis acidaminivorans]KAB2954293.1 bacteriohemerythrin [Heliorestis acidaminivorans]